MINKFLFKLNFSLLSLTLFKMKQSVKFSFSVFIGALLLMFDSFFNGFPIVYSDTSTFIASGFELQTPFDRPITYGLFLRFFSLNGLSLWLVVFTQALIVSFLLILLVKTIINHKNYLLIAIVSILLLSLFTGLSWTVCQLIPDIFTSIALMCLILLLFGKTQKTTTFLLFIIFVISIAMHISHILMFVTILVSIFIFKKRFFAVQENPHLNRTLSILILLTIASVFTMGSAISKSKHVFFMGAMVEHGILKKYLDENCSHQNFKLCAFKDSLPAKAYQFVWDEKSPLYKVGGWSDSKQEFNQIITATLTQPKYILLHFTESLKATFQQLVNFKIGDGNGSFLEGTLLFERISKYFTSDVSLYKTSKQNKTEVLFEKSWNLVFTFFIILSSILLLYLLFLNKLMSKPNKSIFLVFMLGIIINAWDCGTFANAIDRLGCKMMWLIPFMAIIGIQQVYQTWRLPTKN